MGARGEPLKSPSADTFARNKSCHRGMQDGKRLRLLLFRLRYDALLLLVELEEERRERKAVRVFACGECVCLKRHAAELEGLEKIAVYHQANDRGDKCYTKKKAS